MSTKYSRRKRYPEYMAWIAEQPCCICGAWPVEVAHVGARGMSQKCSDLETLPLCVAHHREGIESQHVLGKKFWAYHEIESADQIMKFRSVSRQVGAAYGCVYVKEITVRSMARSTRLWDYLGPRQPDEFMSAFALGSAGS